jgi:hypothetical protein
MQLPLLDLEIDAATVQRIPPKAAKYSILHSEPSKETTLRKYTDIKARFKELRAIRVEGMSLKHSDIVAKLAWEFYMDEFSIGLVLLRKD